MAASILAFTAISLSIQLSAATFPLLDLPSVSYLKKPSETICSEEAAPEILILVHSAPKQGNLRDAVRETWGNKTLVPGITMVFLLGETPDEETDSEIEAESLLHGDIVQATFVDAYRNMTYKHLLGYRWAVDHCPDAKFVLKTDDDQIVDTLHLPKFLSNYMTSEEKDKPFYLCHPVNNPVMRSEDSKWFVTPSEFPESHYPTYCAGWAYVTSILTMRTLLQASESYTGDYFWIDDAFVTGILRREVNTPPVRLLNWSNSFLSHHVQYTADVMSGKMYTPELLVCSDVKEVGQIKLVFSRMAKADKDDLATKYIYANEELKESLRPKEVNVVDYYDKKEFVVKEEL